jgi:hypothetical protein
MRPSTVFNLKSPEIAPITFPILHFSTRLLYTPLEHCLCAKY